MASALGRFFGGEQKRSRRSLGEQLQRLWQRNFSRGELTLLIVAVGLLLMPALSLRAAGWDVLLGVVVPILATSVVLGFLLARSHYNELVALMMSLVYGACFVLLGAALNETGSLTDGIYQVFARMVLWVYDAVNGGINQDEVVFTIMVASLFWFLGYNIAWHVFRYERIHVFRVVLPPGAIIVMNSVYYEGDASLVPYLIIFMFLALVLSVRSYLETREWEWYQKGIRVPTKVRRQFNMVGAGLALLAVIIGWLIPSANLQSRLDSFRELVQENPQQFAEVWNRLFSTIEAYGPVTADYYGGDRLELNGAIQLGNQVVLQVQAPPGRRYYWRSRVFDAYDAGNWTSQRTTEVSVPEAPFSVSRAMDELAAREPVQQTYTMAINASRLVYAAPQPSEVDLPIRASVRYTDASAPPGTNIYVMRPDRVLERGDSYTVTSQMTTATASQLRAAGENYPQWIYDTQQTIVPPSVSSRTLVLAREVVEQAGAVTPYDKAKAIESYLRTAITYDENIPQPPPGQDPVDWVLFDYQRGYCNYYASAMILMLRAQGVPARMGAGFAQGEWDGASYTVRERDAHTWVEVYFPGYGWVEFEPTAAEAPLNRGGADEQLSPTNTPVPTDTPVATATPTLTPSPTVTNTPNPEEQANLDTQREFPTPTLIPSATPTATPMIIPTAEPPSTQQPQGLAGFIASALLTGLIGLLVFAMVAAVLAFVWWWWEWRGLRGMTPAARAYNRLERYVMGLLGVSLQDQQTSFERQEQIVQSLPKNANRPVRAITTTYTQERYGRRQQSEAAAEKQATGLDKAWKRARENILGRYVYRIFPLFRFFRKPPE